MMAVLTVVGWVLLGLLLILLGLLVLVALLLCIPVHLLASYDREAHLRVRYGLITIRLLPKKTAARTEKKPKDKPKKAAKPAKDAASATPKPTLKERLAPYGGLEHLPETMPELLAALKDVGRLLGSFRRCLLIRRLRVEIICGGADAAQAAIHYGQAWPMLLALEQTLRAGLRLRQFEGQPVLDYSCPQQTIVGEADLQLRPIRAVAAAIVCAVRLLRRYLRIRKYGKQGKRPSPTEKGVTVHEQSGT